MKTSSIALALAGASVASAQLDVIAKAPKCAVKCVMSGLGKSSCETTLDLKCQCKQADGLIGQIVPCVLDACSYDEQKTARTLAIDTCKSFGVSISLQQPESRTQDATESSGGSTSASASPTDDSSSSPTDGSPDPTSSPTETGSDGGSDGGSGGGSGGGSDGGSDSSPSEDSEAPAETGAASKPAAGLMAAILAMVAYL